LSLWGRGKTKKKKDKKKVGKRERVIPLGREKTIKMKEGSFKTKEPANAGCVRVMEEGTVARLERL